MPEKTHRLAAIVFTDIVGYTRRMEENEQRTMQLLQQQRDIVFPLVESYEGEVIKEIGDGLMMMFDSAVQAVRFAIAVQTRLKDEELTIRAGIHIGDVIFKGGDVFGSAVNTAARVEPLAPSNGICISEDVQAQIQNKSEFITISRGKRELKGVSEPLEIFEIFIEGVSKKQNKNIGYIFKDLWRRNVIQIAIGYIAGAWIVKQAVAAIVAQYVLSPHIVQLSWILLISLLPAVMILSYFHGKRSSGRWTKVELFGLPVNLLLSIALLFIMFNGKDLGAAMERVTIETEDGESITRAIPKSEFRKDIALFFFDNETQDKEYDWLQYGLTTALVYDISQDAFIEANNAIAFMHRFRENGSEDGLDVSLMMKSSIAEQQHCDFFVTGSFNREGTQWVINMQFYDTFKGSKMGSIVLKDEDLFVLVDKGSLEIKKALGVPTARMKESKDMPVAEIFTSSIPAFKEFILSTLQIHLQNDYSEGIVHAEKAVEIDPDFAIAHLTLAEMYFNTNMPEKTEKSVDITMDKLYKLPERHQFSAKFFYYIIRQQAEQGTAVLKMWTDLYPHDVNAHVSLAQRYRMNNDFDLAIDQYKYITEIAPNEYEYIRTLGDIYESMGNLDSSLYYYEMYADKFPGEASAYRNLGDTYFRMSKFDLAMENYNKAQLIEPDNSSTALKMARVHMTNGNFNQAENLLLSMLESGNTSQDSILIYTGLEGLAEMLGKINLSFEYLQNRFALYKNTVPPLRYMVLQIFSISKYSMVGKQKEALALLQKVEKELQPPLNKVAAFGYLFYYTDNKDPEKASQHVEDAMSIIEGFGEEMLIANIHYAEGRIAELEQDYMLAVEEYSKYQKLHSTNADVYRWIARSFAEAGKLDEAFDNIEESMTRSPNDPKTLYEAARIHQQDGNTQQAMDYIRKANEIWKDADASYEPARKAREFSTSLEEV